MAFGKKNKPPVETNPHEVAALGQKHEEQAAKDSGTSVYDHFHANEAAVAVEKAKKRRKLYAGILIGLLAILLIMYIISMLLTQWGDLVISVGDLRDGKTIMLCESSAFDDGVTMKLDGGVVKEVTNITKSWLPKNLDTEKDGQHNGENYLAYTFYLKNTGDADLDYQTVMNVTGTSKSVDEAVRVMVYKNGEPEVFAKENRGLTSSDGKPEAFEKIFKKEIPENFTPPTKEEIEAAAEQPQNKEPVAHTDEEIVIQPFVDSKTVFNTEVGGLEPGATDKYTIVMWIEGEDPECLDVIRGGYVKLMWFFNIADEEL